MSDYKALDINIQARVKPPEVIWHQTIAVTKTWNDLKPPKTIYNHLKPPQKIQQPPTTTSKTSTTNCKQTKTIENKARRGHGTYMEYENQMKHPPLPKILLSLVPCIINRGLSHETSISIILFPRSWNSTTIWLLFIDCDFSIFEIMFKMSHYMWCK